MTNDIVERLRNYDKCTVGPQEAADTIEALRAENARLKAEMEELRKSKMGRLAWYKMRDEEERAAMGETDKRINPEYADRRMGETD